MCGIAGIVSITGAQLPRLDASLDVLSQMVGHRGPDGHGRWVSRAAAPGSPTAASRSSI